MTGKYIDLAERIIGNVEACSDYDNGVADALRWLDEHPEAVPGRTITESRIAKAFGAEYVAWARMCLARIGITVVPDPEPTNAEKLADYVRQINRTAMSAEECGKWLDAKGVQAPKGDEQ